MVIRNEKQNGTFLSNNSSLINSLSNKYNNYLNNLNKMVKSYKTLSFVILSTLAVGCEFPNGVVVGGTAVTVVPVVSQPQSGLSTFSVATETSGSDAICDPFGVSENVSAQNGLLGKMFYLKTDQPRYLNVADYLSHGQEIDANIFFNQLNIPTRMFDQGFVTQDGAVLKIPDGTTLYEYFALHMLSNLRLGPGDREGDYQLSILSDDGSVVSINDTGSGFRTLINNDLYHEPKLGCATETISMNSDTILPIQVDYFQGPRYNIALMLLWRFIEDNADKVSAMGEVNCGKFGNSYFFDPTKTPSVAKQPWLSMLARGWNVISPANYFLPGSTLVNTCTGSCFTDNFVRPQWNRFELSHRGVDASTFNVTVKGQKLEFIYDPILNMIEIPSIVGLPTDEVHIGYCLQAPSPTPSPTLAPAPTPHATPTCSGIACGVLGS